MRVFNEIRLNNLRGDLFGGVTAAVVALPMALAFGVASGAGAEAGLYGAVLIGLFAALFGGTPTLISEPTGPMTVVFTAVIASLIAADPEQGLAMAFTVVMLTGVFQIAFGAMRLGRYVTMMPYTVVSGFMSGIGIILIILQFPGLLGHATPEGGVLGSLAALPGLVMAIDPWELLLAGLTLAVLFLMPARIKRFLPAPLVALVVGTAVAVYWLGHQDLRVIGEIPTGLPQLQLPVFSAAQWQIIVVDALVLALLGSVDALLTSVIASNLTRKNSNSDKELVGQGLGNMASGLFGGLPGAGATMGTVVNIQSGGRTALSGLVRAALLAVVVIWAADLTASIPLAVLAGIAVKVGVDIIDWRFLRRAHRVSLKGAFILYGVIVVTVFVDLIMAVAIGLFVANILTIRRLADVQAEWVCTLPPSRDGDDDASGSDITTEERALLALGGGRVKMLHLSGPLVFGAAASIRRQEHKLEAAQAVVVDLSRVPHLGVTTSVALDAALMGVLKRNVPLYVAGAQGQPRERLEKLGFGELVGADGWVDERKRALEKALAAINGGGSSGSGEPGAGPQSIPGPVPPA
ncbi:SulP family inorganic anion transporter [Ectothiorhodospira sp. BSL-9]|uniref:SulP family inorganic anion transporter n=1 Tax=Ectothiorhodospira sp. BSL-9 TaxID=1442136 RepID=UPI0007B43850|nr:SulP family inorganic anion transporter [Ectothiorhodospira sp. BSL-9]ANB01501.1 Bicarbonate transporter BicA [Ectothiorhodospira sp. BSL-9]TVQ74048.1 MAG: SulP family inorganic anion transporter [Chromatiaceae bacterium]